MIFVLDNYDSFTYNLVQYLGELGAEVVVRRNDQVTVEEIERLGPERIVVSPGPCTPHEAGISIDLIRHFAGKVPLLGVCLGHQAIGEAFGGKSGPRQATDARQDEPGGTRRQDHIPRPALTYDGDPLSLAHRRGRKTCLPIWKSAPGRQTRGDGVIMGLRHRKFPIEGVQFHPESVLTGEGKKLMANFLKM